MGDQGREQRAQEAVTQLLGQAPGTLKRAEPWQSRLAAAWLQQEEAGFPAPLSPPAQCGSRAWVRGSCAARVTGASLVQGSFIKPASWILNHLTFSYQRCPGRSCGGWSGSWQPATRYPKAGWAGGGSRFSISPWAEGDVLGWRACRGLCRLVKDHVMPL